MKSLKLFTTLFLCVALCLGFVSCTDDDKGNASALVGVWEYEEEDYYETIEFKSNGALIISSEEYYNGEWEHWTERGTYVYKDEKLIVEIEGDVVIVEVMSLTSKTLKLRNEDGESITYKRVD
jgi:uncharacterized protein (TIGR03066 family)